METFLDIARGIAKWMLIWVCLLSVIGLALGIPALSSEALEEAGHGTLAWFAIVHGSVGGTTILILLWRWSESGWDLGGEARAAEAHTFEVRFKLRAWSLAAHYFAAYLDKRHDRLEALMADAKASGETRIYDLLKTERAECDGIRNTFLKMFERDGPFERANENWR